MRRPARASAWLLGLAFLATSVHAQDTTEGRLREALRQTAEKLHAAEADLAQQQLATAAAESERDALKQAPPAAHVDTAQTVALQRRLAAADGELSQAHAEAQKWQAAQQVAAQAAQQKEAERTALAEQLSKLSARAERCVASDEALYRTGREIAALYRDPAFSDPVHWHHLWPLGFARVREENRVRGLEDHLTEQLAEAQRCRTDAPPAKPAPAAASVSPAPTGGNQQ